MRSAITRNGTGKRRLQPAAVDEILAKMAYSRQQFKDRVEEKVGGALLEFYIAECATANGLTRWVEHWRSEAKRLLGELQVVLLHEIRGFRDRRKAFEEVLVYVAAQDSAYRRAAESAVRRDFKMKKLKAGVPAAATDRFYEMVRNAVDAVFA